MQTPSGREVSSHFGYGSVKSIPLWARSKRIPMEVPSGLLATARDTFLKHWDCLNTRKHAFKTFPVSFCRLQTSKSKRKEKGPSTQY